MSNEAHHSMSDLIPETTEKPAIAKRKQKFARSFTRMGSIYCTNW